MTRTFEQYLNENLKNPEEAITFFQVVIEEFLEDNNLSNFNKALGILVKSHGSVSNFAKISGINRTHLYKIFNSEIEPKLSTLKNILYQLGYKITISPIEKVA